MPKFNVGDRVHLVHEDLGEGVVVNFDEVATCNGHIIAVFLDSGSSGGYSIESGPLAGNSAWLTYENWCELVSPPPKAAPVPSQHRMGLDAEVIDADAYREFMKGL